MRLSAALITLNEENNIEACLESVKWMDEIVIVDGGSTDATVHKASRYTSKIKTQAFTDFSTQKNTALQMASGDWVFFIDADERVTPELREEILAILAQNSPEAVYAVHRKTYFFGGRLRFSGTPGDYPVRFFPRGRVLFEQPVHEKVVTNLPVRRMKSDLLHYTTRDIRQYRSKLDLYVRLEQSVLLAKGRKPGVFDLVLRPPVIFLLLYFGKLGFLDGWPGLQYAFLSAYYAFLKYKKLLESGKSHESVSCKS
jgi:glycosyltransferase involved in cell wall biosynthesis